jgi:diguanylate cyclase (GGDEF)-like protein
MDMPPELLTVDGEVVAVRLAGQEFPCEPETSESIIPKKALTGFRLSEIPEDLIIKPVESIAGAYIEIKNDIALSSFAGGSASAYVEIMLRRKYWDGEVGLSPYIEAYRLAIREQEDAEETDFQDDGDYIFLYYEIRITEDLEIENAIRSVEGAIGVIEERAEQLVRRRVDPLLGIFDRGSFDADLAHALKHSEPEVGLVLIDIDHFKKVNDEDGHQIGDAVLRAVGLVLSTQCGQRGATAYRYGGEELAAILTATDGTRTMDFAESVRKEVEKLSFEYAAKLKVTISLGIALAPRDGNSGEELLKKADAALYRAKNEGRNRARSSS